MVPNPAVHNRHWVPDKEHSVGGHRTFHNKHPWDLPRMVLTHWDMERLHRRNLHDILFQFHRPYTNNGFTPTTKIPTTFLYSLYENPFTKPKWYEGILTTLRIKNKVQPSSDFQPYKENPWENYPKTWNTKWSMEDQSEKLRFCAKNHRELVSDKPRKPRFWPPFNRLGPSNPSTVQDW